MAAKLPLVLAEDSAEADDTSPCLACAHRVDLGGGREGVMVRLTLQSQVSCERCKCMLGFVGCTNTPRRGGCVPACRSCLKVLEGRVAELKGKDDGTRYHRNGAPEALHLIHSDTSSLRKKRDHTSVRKHSGSNAMADAIYKAHGKPGLAARVVSQKALQMRDPAVATKLMAASSRLPKRRGTLTSRKGGHGAKGPDIKRANGYYSWGDRTSLSVVVSGDAPLRDVEAATSSTVQRYRATKVESDGKSVDERAVLLRVTRSASRVEATLASQPSAATRRTASARAKAVQRHLLEGAKAKASLKASRSPEEEARLAEERKRGALRRCGVTDASVSGATPRDGAAVIETTRKIREDKNTTHRRQAERSRAAHRAATGQDHKTIAIEKQRESLAKSAASKKRARDDPDSCRVVYCPREGCKYHGVPKPFAGSSLKQCYECGRRMAFM